MSALVLLYIPVPDRKTGRELTREALDRRLAACGNLIGPVESLYEWEGALQEATEWVLILKTTPECAGELAGWVEEAHPYDTPAVIRLNGEADARFAAWVSGACAGGGNADRAST